MILPEDHSSTYHIGLFKNIIRRVYTWRELFRHLCCASNLNFNLEYFEIQTMFFFGLINAGNDISVFSVVSCLLSSHLI